jgi:alanine-synthesizing transaminase
MFSRRTEWELAPNRLTQTLEELRAAGTPLLDLSISNPTQCGLRYDESAILAAFQDPAALTYDPQPKSLRSAREAVARYYREDHNATVDPDSLFLTTSTSEAYSYVFRLLCNAHDEILVPKPSYPLFDFLAGLQDVSLVPYSLEYAQGWFIDLDSVARALTPRTRAILLVHPNNPTGSYVKPEELRRLNQLCRERNLALIVDEVFLDYALDGPPRHTFAANQDALTFSLSGLSKIAALPQMKVAWVATTGPDSLTRPALDRLEVIADTYLSLNAPIQHALPNLLAQRQSLQSQLLARIQKNYRLLKERLAGHSHCEPLHVDGGWYAVLRVPSERSDEDLAIELARKHHVLVHPGHFYDFPRDGFLVLSLITRPDVFTEGLTRLLRSFAHQE